MQRVVRMAEGLEAHEQIPLQTVVGPSRGLGGVATIAARWGGYGLRVLAFSRSTPRSITAA